MLARAVEEQQQVIRMYPSSVQNWLELVMLCETDLADCGAGVSQRAAQRTLDLEQTNRQWGHQDRYLSEEQLKFLQKTAGEQRKMR